MNPIDWIKSHPFKAILFASLFTFIASAGAAAHQPSIAAVVYALVVFAWVGIVWRDSRRLLVYALAGCLVLSPTRAEEPPQQAGILPVVAGTVVVVVGGVVVYKLIKFCQKYLSPPPDTNAPPAEFGFDGPASGDSYGATSSSSPYGSCLPDGGGLAAFDQAPPVETAFRLRTVVDDSGALPVARLQAFSVEPAAEQVDWSTFETDLDGLGLYLSPYGGGASSFSRNGQRCDASEVPIWFDNGTVVVDLGGPLYHVSVDRSTDLQAWQTVLSTWITAGVPMQITDTSTDASSFYRVRVE